jgi:hypothetical protein
MFHEIHGGNGRQRRQGRTHGGHGGGENGHYQETFEHVRHLCDHENRKMKSLALIPGRGSAKDFERVALVKTPTASHPRAKKSEQGEYHGRA